MYQIIFKVEGFPLGFNVNDSTRVVTVDHSHNHYAVTSVNGNPKTQCFDGLDVTSIFKRTKGKRSKKMLGDNSPMLYALKGMQRLNTTYSSVSLLLRNYYTILDCIVSECGADWDCVIPMPSSHKISHILAKRIERKTKARLENIALKKISAYDARSQVKRLNITSKEKAQLNSFIKRFAQRNSWSEDFQMKSITKPNLRCHVKPVMLHRFLVSNPPQNILLVDDMVTSGSTLKSAEFVIKQRYPFSKVTALTLFSATN